MRDKITNFAQGERIHLKYTDISVAGLTPTAIESGYSFYFTVLEKESRVSAVSLTNAGMTLDDNGGSPFVTFNFLTDSMSAELLYECDFWVDKTGIGPVRLDTFYLRLDTPETTAFP